MDKWKDSESSFERFRHTAFFSEWTSYETHLHGLFEIIFHRDEQEITKGWRACFRILFDEIKDQEKKEEAWRKLIEVWQNVYEKVSCIFGLFLMLTHQPQDDSI